MIRAFKILVLIQFCFAGSVTAQRLDLEGLIIEVQENYKRLNAYEAEGKTFVLIKSPSTYRSEGSFSIRLAKPNRYRIVWESEPPYGGKQVGAVWNSGNGPYLYMGIMKASSKMTTDQMALASATGISGGIAHHIPSRFFSMMGIGYAPIGLDKLKLVKMEKIDGEECYVIEGSSEFTAKETLWISKKRKLIIKTTSSLEAPKRRKPKPIPKMTDAEIEQTLKAMGQKVTEKSKKRLKEMMKRAEKVTTETKLKGSRTIVYENIRTDTKPAKKDFEYKVPKGTVLKRTLFGKVFAAPSEDTMQK